MIERSSKRLHMREITADDLAATFAPPGKRLRIGVCQGARSALL